MSTTQAADYFGVHIKTIRRWLKAGKLNAEFVNGQWQIYIDVLENVPPQKPDSVPGCPPDNAEERAQDNVHLHLQIQQLEAQLEHAEMKIRHLTENVEEKTNDIRYFREQLTEKDNQLTRRDQQTDHLTQLLAVQTKTNAALTDRLQAIEDMRHRRTVWQRFRAFFVTEAGSG